MDNNGTSVNDDELNQMIANLSKPAGDPAAVVAAGNSVPPVAPVVAPVAPPSDNIAPTIPAPVATDPPIAPTNPIDPIVAPAPDPVNPPVAIDNNIPTANPELDNIKKDALNELRPLVDKLDLPADEKFDTLLLMIRTTDDSTLIPAAHATAVQIADDTRRAQALLDIIKEIDFFGQNK